MAAVWGAASSITTVTTAATMANRQMPQPYGAPGLPEIALTDALSQQHGHAHGKPCDDNGDGLHDLAAGGHGGDVRRRAEAPHNL